MIISNKNENGPASVGALPDRGSTNPQKDTEMNSTDHSTGVEFSPERIEEMKQAAALPWNQWQRTSDVRAWQPPTNDQWVKAINPHLITLRLAFASMFQSREETMAAMEGLEKDELFVPLMESIEDAIAFFTPILEVLQGAEARFLVAGSVLCLRDMETAQ